MCSIENYIPTLKTSPFSFQHLYKFYCDIKVTFAFGNVHDRSTGIISVSELLEHLRMQQATLNCHWRKNKILV